MKADRQRGPGHSVHRSGPEAVPRLRNDSYLVWHATVDGWMVCRAAGLHAPLDSPVGAVGVGPAGGVDLLEQGPAGLGGMQRAHHHTRRSARLRCSQRRVSPRSACTCTCGSHACMASSHPPGGCEGDGKVIFQRHPLHPHQLILLHAQLLQEGSGHRRRGAAACSAQKRSHWLAVLRLGQASRNGHCTAQIRQTG